MVKRVEWLTKNELFNHCVEVACRLEGRIVTHFAISSNDEVSCVVEPGGTRLTGQEFNAQRMLRIWRQDPKARTVWLTPLQVCKLARDHPNLFSVKQKALITNAMLDAVEEITDDRSIIVLSL